MRFLTAELYIYLVPRTQTRKEFFCRGAEAWCDVYNTRVYMCDGVTLYLSQVARSTRHVLTGSLPHCTPALAQLPLPSRNITMTASAWTGRTPLEEVDPDILGLIREEKQRQVCGLELIASEVMSSFVHTHTHTPHHTSLSLSLSLSLRISPAVLS